MHYVIKCVSGILLPNSHHKVMVLNELAILWQALNWCRRLLSTWTYKSKK